MEIPVIALYLYVSAFFVILVHQINRLIRAWRERKKNNTESELTIKQWKEHRDYILSATKDSGGSYQGSNSTTI
jgi:hypothetical protein